MARFSALSAAVVALALSGQAALVAGQGLDACVQKAIQGAGCSAADAKCMCKGAAEGSFLTDVLSGMVQYCPKTVNASSLLSTVAAGCKSEGYNIPQQNIQEAQQLANTVFGNGGSTGGSGGGSTAGNGGGGSNTASQAPTVTKPPTHQETEGLGAPVSQPANFGQTTAVINTDAAASAGGAASTLIMAPSATPKPNTASQSSSSSAPSSSGGATAGGSNGNNQNAGVRSTASIGAAVIGLAAAVMLW